MNHKERFENTKNHQLPFKKQFIQEETTKYLHDIHGRQLKLYFATGNLNSRCSHKEKRE